MSTRLKEATDNSYGNYILPFLWMHGESEEVLRKEINKIHECGIGAFCVESRPHPDFVGKGWWADMDIAIDEAKKLGMKIWILDDSHFPTGTAAGQAAVCDEENRKSVLGFRIIDVTGPLSGCSFIPPQDVDTDKLVYIIAANIEDDKMCMDITDKFTDGRLYFDVPDGIWRIYYFYINSDCIHSPHINHLRKGGAKVLLDAVYEPHFEHYATEFGATIAGFFSDEPGFFACERGFDSYERTLGSEHISLPWDRDLSELLTKEINLPIAEILPALSDNAVRNKKKTAFIRYQYMNIITRLYDECFCSVIGAWCREHGVDYIGHITEDNNTHCRIGLSAGHFFRAMKGQDYSGCDVVLHQVLPGMEDIDHAAATGFYANSLSDGAFYTYSLYNMATSLAQIDSRKKGRAMCELFGAYGWGEGCKMMKWLADFLLVRGINHFVPHAFSPKAFPDDDCPPHFYAHGFNPQFEGFKALMPYMNRIAHLINGGHHDAEIAVLYDGDFAWTGGEVMLSQTPCRKLARAHLQYDIIPADFLFDAKTADGSLLINTQSYKVLIVPYTEYIPTNYREALESLSDSGLTVIFAESLPKYCIGKNAYEAFPENAPFKAVAEDELAAICKSVVSRNIIIEDIENSDILQLYAYKHNDDTIYMLNNSHPTKTISAYVTFAESGSVVEYDAYNNKAYACKKQCRITLPAYQSRIFVVGDTLGCTACGKPDFKSSTALNSLSWTVSLCNAEHYPSFEFYESTNVLANYNVPDKLPNFSGIIRYEAEFDIDFDIPESCAVRFSGVSETLQLWINDEYCGICIAPPYLLPIGGKLRKGRNKIRIETRNTLYNSINDVFSRYLPIEATGITGDITLLY